jgi:hypothetical protein
VGALVTLELAEDSPLLDLPWIITFGPFGDEDGWEPLVCGPYERPHALGLAEAVVADEELMAVVEPLLPSVSPDEIRSEIATARLAAEEGPADDGGFDDYADAVDSDLPVSEQEDSGQPRPAPSPVEVRAGFHRIAALLTGRN